MRLVDNQPHGRLLMADEYPATGTCTLCGKAIQPETRTCAKCAMEAIDAILHLRVFAPQTS